MRIFMLLVAAVLAMVTVIIGASGAAAVSPAERECEAAGGEYSFSQGTATCIIEEPFSPGNPQSGNANEPFTNEEEDTQKGQGGGGGGETNKHHEEEEENTNPSGNAPPGHN